MTPTEEQDGILLLCENEQASHLDRRAIRDAGYNVVQVMSSGIEAARKLAGLAESERRFSMVVCSNKLSDMDGEQFCAIVRSHPLLLYLPILLLLPNADEACQLEALGCGASALLARPYTVDALAKQLGILEKAASPMRNLAKAAEKMDTSAFDSALASYGLLLRPERQPDDYFRVGMKFLQEKRWNYAISAFQKALIDAHIKAEAELGMAAAFKGKGDMARFRGWLGRAADTLVHAKRWHQARTAYARLLQHDPEARNPFLAEAHRLIRAQNYDEAANMLAQSLGVIPRGITGDKLAQLCMAADSPEEMLQALENGLARGNPVSTKFLSQDIAKHLESMNREKVERQRQLAAERKWEHTRRQNQARAQQQTEKAEKSEKNEVRQSFPAIPLIDESVDDEEAFPAAFYPEDDDVDKNAAAPLHLEPLPKTTDDKRHAPANDFLSVVKLTWNLAKRAKKKE